MLPVMCTPKWLPSKASKATVVQKHRPRNPHPDKLLKDMNEQELQDSLPYAKALGDKELVFKVFHYLLSHSSDQNNLKTYKLDLADYCFSLKDYEKAGFSYEDFAMHYPGCKEIEYAKYKAIISWFSLCLEPGRDQLLTNKTIFLIDDYLKGATNEKFIEEVKAIRAQCRQRLFEHEMHIVEHYMKQKKVSSVNTRLTYIEEHFKDIAHLEHYVSYCKHMVDIVKDPKKCPFLIKFNLADALPQSITHTPAKKAKTALFFLS